MSTRWELMSDVLFYRQILLNLRTQ
jgi:hypothetical protein